jgi:hypothetical protein
VTAIVITPLALVGGVFLIDVPDDVTLPDAVALRPTIGQMFPLERASDVHAAIEARTTLGKTLLVVR